MGFLLIRGFLIFSGNLLDYARSWSSYSLAPVDEC